MTTPPTDKSVQPPSKEAASKAPAPKKNTSLKIVTLVLLTIGIAWFCLWFFYWRFYEYTDDAYVNGNLININSAISGNVIGFYADDTDLVTEGQVLAALDATKYQVGYDREIASLAAIVLEVQELYDTVRVNEMDVKVKEIALSKVRYDHQNRAELVQSLAISNEDFTHSKDDLNTAEYQLQQAKDQLKVAQDAVGNTTLLAHPKIEQQKGNVREAFYNLKHCIIYSPATGYVAQRNVNVGQWVSPTTNMMAVIPIDYVWVDANFKETQLTYMRIGQSAEVWFDLYGSEAKYTGKVIGIASGSGSVFSLIPPQNATGNWIKIVQRLPVRISLDPETLKKFPPRLGISAEVDVDIIKQDLPRLAQIPSKKAVAVTSVYELNMREVNDVIDKVIQDTLRMDYD